MKNCSLGRLSLLPSHNVRSHPHPTCHNVHHHRAHWSRSACLCPSPASHIGSGYLAERVYSTNPLLTTIMMIMVMRLVLIMMIMSMTRMVAKMALMICACDRLGDKALLSLKPSVSDHSWFQHEVIPGPNTPSARPDMSFTQQDIPLPHSVFVFVIVSVSIFVFANDHS